MPLRDLFARPRGVADWYSMTPMWVLVLLQHLNRSLPREYRGYPVRVRGEFADPPTEDEFTLRLVSSDPDDERLVASVEFVSPRNKDRPESRRMLVAKCVGLLNQGVCVSIVDCVTNAHFNLCADLLDFLGHADPIMTGPPVPHTYAVTVRKREVFPRWRLETWAHPLAVGQTFPTLPIWLTDTLHLELELEPTYEETCETLLLPE